ncbi:carboxypeptidase-like regulatory domain-containing protein [Adhaeribacter pallidiroseus]|uniref:Uncharacterized protein n=1 Tax=Adhaeribacter pallidiroseus TaxID=2072847 RepID=A0A369QPZ5_9BACT|nr:carboxypeptidase-like regulatory domain-containing protein [Adhaeribacter pallidiroseus]RDC65745.1 hypothetical protein AHMF7616_04375 [Adhaeribacter pallidiroseus]
MRGKPGYLLLSMSHLMLWALLVSCTLVKDKGYNLKTGGVFIMSSGDFSIKKVTLTGEKTYFSDDSIYFKNVVPGKYELEIQFISTDNSSRQKPVLWRTSVVKNIIVSADSVTFGSIQLHCEYNSATQFLGEQVPRLLLDTTGKIAGSIAPFDESFREAHLSERYPNVKVTLFGRMGSKVYEQITLADSSGKFIFDHVKPGIYTLIAEAGFQSFSNPRIINIIVLPTKTALVKIDASLNTYSSIRPDVYIPCGFDFIHWQKNYR